MVSKKLRFFGESVTEDSFSASENSYLLPNNDRDTRSYVPARYVLAMLSFAGFINIFTLRMDLNIAILSITSNNTVDGDQNFTSTTPKYDWSVKRQNMALSSFYYGYCSTQILGGYMAGRFGGKRVMGFCILFTSVVALLTPIAIMTSYGLLLLCRVVQGLAQGLVMPCMHTMWSKWAPEPEKSKLITFAYSGCQMGNIIATLATSYMCEASPTLRWALVFYVYGSAGVVWSIAWLLLVHDTPAQHPRISTEELTYIERTIAHPVDQVRPKTPWCKILSSPAFYAIVVAHFANDWGCFALTTCLPMYMKHVLHIKIKENGILSSLAFIILLFTNPASGFLADWLISRGILSTKNSRKLLNSIGLFIPSCLMVGVCFAESSRSLTIVLLTFAVGFTGFTMAGYTVNPLDIVPPFAGLMYGMSNTVGTTTGFIGPVILSFLTEKHNGMSEWRIFFIITAAIFFVGGLVFLLLAEGEPQEWVQPYLNDVMTRRYSQIHSNSIIQGDDDSSIGYGGLSDSENNPPNLV